MYCYSPIDLQLIDLSQQERSIKLNCFIDEIFAREIVFDFLRFSKSESVKFKLSLIVLSCFSDMTDKKRKYCKFLSKKKLREQTLDNGCPKACKIDKVFLCNAIAQMTRQFFNIKKSLF